MPSPSQCRMKQVCDWTLSSPKSAWDPRADCQQLGPNTRLLSGVGYSWRTMLESCDSHHAPVCASLTPDGGKVPRHLFLSMGNTTYIQDRGGDWICIPARCHLERAYLQCPKEGNIWAEDELNYLLHLIQTSRYSMGANSNSCFIRMHVEKATYSSLQVNHRIPKDVANSSFPI